MEISTIYATDKVLSVLYSKYSTVVKKYSTLDLVMVCANNSP